MSRLIIFTVLMATLSGCATVSMEKQADINGMEETTLDRLEEQHPDLRGKLGSMPGYLVVEMNVLKIPVLGGGGGKGVIVENKTGKRTYVKVSRMEIGGGWGGRRYKILLVFSDPELLKKAQSGKWIGQMGAEASVGKIGVEGSSGQLQQDKGYEMFVLSEGGASATWTLRAIRLKPYRQ